MRLSKLFKFYSLIQPSFLKYTNIRIAGIADAIIIIMNVVNGPKNTALPPIPPGKLTFIP